LLERLPDLLLLKVSQVYIRVVVVDERRRLERDLAL